MIDRDTGALILPGGGGGGRLTAGTTRKKLLASPLGRGAAVEDMGTGWVWVDLGQHQLAGRTLLVRASFEGERLDGYTLFDVDPRFGSSWDDWSEEKEKARKKAHDAWLAAALGAPKKRGGEPTYAFPWGEAWSTLDPRGGSASIGVRFAIRPPE